MGYRLQRSIRLGKFVKLNISKSGVGISAGVRGFRISTGPRGTNLSLGIPGTGLSYRKQLSSKSKRRKKETKKASPPPSQPAAQQMSPQAIPEEPQGPVPGFLASKAERELAKGLEDLQADNMDEALDHFLKAAPDEPGAAILAAIILDKIENQEYQAIQLLESVIQDDEEFPTELMQKYLPDADVDIDITPSITASVSLDGLAATLQLVELYQATRRVREAIALLEEIEELAHEPVLTLSLCELYASRNMWDDIIDRGKGITPQDDITLGVVIFYGRAMLEKDLDEAAVTVFTKALKFKKVQNPLLLHAARYWRAVAYQEQGKARQSNTEFQKLFAEAPDFRDVAQRLESYSIN